MSVFLKRFLMLAISVLGACGGNPSDIPHDAGTVVRTDGGVVPSSQDAGSPSTSRCEAVRNSIQEAGFDDKVSVTCDDVYAYITSDTYPGHVKMTGITGTNDQVPVPAPIYQSPVRLQPKMGTSPVSIDAALGIAVNGVPIYDYSSQGSLQLDQYDARFDTKLTGELDLCNGHSGRGDDYHYHAEPVCLIANMKNQGASAILGWAFDGFPIYGKKNPDGTAIATGKLDVCNGQADDTFGYRYHTSDTAPYILQCLKGEFDLNKAPRVAPLSKIGGGGKPPGAKPPGGVQNLQLTESPDGTRTMTYEHQGKSYSITYKPSSTSGCWDFDEKSYTTGGLSLKATYCRTSK